MAGRDSEIIDRVITEWLNGTGISLKTRTVCHALGTLRKSFGEDFNLAGAIDFLKGLAEATNGIKSQLEQEMAKSQPK